MPRRWPFYDKRDAPELGANCYSVPMWETEPPHLYHGVAIGDELKLLGRIDVDRKGRLLAKRIAASIAWTAVESWHRGSSAPARPP